MNNENAPRTPLTRSNNSNLNGNANYFADGIDDYVVKFVDESPFGKNSVKNNSYEELLYLLLQTHARAIGEHEKDREFFEMERVSFVKTLEDVHSINDRIETPQLQCNDCASNLKLLEKLKSELNIALKRIPGSEILAKNSSVNEKSDFISNSYMDNAQNRIALDIASEGAVTTQENMDAIFCAVVDEEIKATINLQARSSEEAEKLRELDENFEQKEQICEKQTVRIRELEEQVRDLVEQFEQQEQIRENQAIRIHELDEQISELRKQKETRERLHKEQADSLRELQEQSNLLRKRETQMERLCEEKDSRLRDIKEQQNSYHEREDQGEHMREKLSGRIVELEENLLLLQCKDVELQQAHICAQIMDREKASLMSASARLNEELRVAEKDRIAIEARLATVEAECDKVTEESRALGHEKSAIISQFQKEKELFVSQLDNATSSIAANEEERCRLQEQLVHVRNLANASTEEHKRSEFQNCIEKGKLSREISRLKETVLLQRQYIVNMKYSTSIANFIPQNPEICLNASAMTPNFIKESSKCGDMEKVMISNGPRAILSDLTNTNT